MLTQVILSAISVHIDEQDVSAQTSPEYADLSTMGAHENEALHLMRRGFEDANARASAATERPRRAPEGTRVPEVEICIRSS